jgi:hypothetical protein
MLTEASQSKITNTTGFLPHDVPREVKFTEAESRIVGASSWGRRNGEVVFKRFTVSTWGDERVLEGMAVMDT